MTPARVASPMPAGRSTAPSAAPSAKATPDRQLDEKSGRKRKSRPEDEIDQLFEQKLGKKIKKAGLAPETPPPTVALEQETQAKDPKERKRKKGDDDGRDKDLKDILGAIKAAPKGEDKGRKHKKKKAA